jgi:hypothetical protein
MIARNLCLLLAMTISTVAFGESRKISTCFEEGLAALRLNQLEDGIDHCHQVIEDKAAPLDRRGQAYAQRGLMQARRWAVLSTTAFAVQGIADITEALRLHTPTPTRKHHLLFVRARLYVAVGQTKRASDDLTAILKEDPRNADADDGLKRLGTPNGF